MGLFDMFEKHEAPDKGTNNIPGGNNEPAQPSVAHVETGSEHLQPETPETSAPLENQAPETFESVDSTPDFTSQPAPTSEAASIPLDNRQLSHESITEVADPVATDEQMDSPPADIHAEDDVQEDLNRVRADLGSVGAEDVPDENDVETQQENNEMDSSEVDASREAAQLFDELDAKTKEIEKLEADREELLSQIRNLIETREQEHAQSGRELENMKSHPALQVNGDEQ